MTQEESATLFFMFLDYCGALESWNQQRFGGLYLTAEHFLNGTISFIATKEGLDYWLKINSEWLEILNEI